MSTLIAKIKHEIMKALRLRLFSIILDIIAIVRALMIRGTGISLPTSTSVLIASLILGKSVLVADMLPFINRFPDKPLAWKRRMEDADVRDGRAHRPLSRAAL